jgi:hypothetical protein
MHAAFLSIKKKQAESSVWRAIICWQSETARDNWPGNLIADIAKQNMKLLTIN